MKKQLFILSSLCLLASSCEMDKRAEPSQEQTPSMDLPQNEADRDVTQKVRQKLLEDDSLSTNAKNIKIVTMDGVVTLRGKVSNKDEKNAIEKNTKGVNGVKDVDNQLDILMIETVPAEEQGDSDQKMDKE